MKVCILSGSPKGKNSITYQTMLYLEQIFKNCSFTTLHVGQRIRSLEKDRTQAYATIREADMIVFCYPVYTFIVPCQLHRFIELMKADDLDVRGKFAVQISTSKHFYDTTAHAFIRENCEDMGMKYLGGLSQDMEDLLKEEGQKTAVAFWKRMIWNAKHDVVCPKISKGPSGSGSLPYGKHTAPVSSAWQAVSGAGLSSADNRPDAADPAAAPAKTCKAAAAAGYGRCLPDREKKPGYETVIVAVLEKDDTELAAMIEDFRCYYPYETKLVNLCDYPFDGGCLGCFNCAVSGKCIYKDGFDDFLRGEIQTGSAIVYAYRVKDHSMGSVMKMFDDRQFCNGHRTVTMGMPIGYLVAGGLEGEANLRMIMEGRADVGGNFLAGIAEDTKGIKDLCKALPYALRHKTEMPPTFLGVGGMKIFRDLIYVMQGMMKADHAFYKEHGFYDFPQKDKATIMKMKMVGMLLSNPKLYAKAKGKMTEGMLMPYKKVLEQKGGHI